MRKIDIFDMLEQVRLRAEMYFGRPGALPLLEALLTGMAMRPVDPGMLDLMELRWWMAARIVESHDGNNAIMHWLTERLGPEPAFDAFFEDLDEFRANTAELLWENSGPLVSRFSEGEGSEPRPPERLVVGRFAPSEIYF